MLHADFHSHVMPGVDDGSRSAVETIAMARDLVALGVTRLYLTPHQFKLGNRLTLVDVQKRVDDVWRILARADVSLEVCRGAEHYYGEEFLDAVSRQEDVLIPFDWEGERGLLVELPMGRPSVGVERLAQVLAERGFKPLLAHPERTRHCTLDRAMEWKDAGWSLQLNLLSLVGRHGPEAEQMARTLLQADAYDCVGSDVHRPADLAWLRDAHKEFRSISEVVAS